MNNEKNANRFIKTLLIIIGVAASVAAITFGVCVLLKKFKKKVAQFNEESAECSEECDSCDAPCEDPIGDETKTEEPECVFVD